jgi:uncharacterized protein (TIGR03437 family)
MVVTVYGVTGRFDSIFPVAGSTGFPTEVRGLSVDFVQGSVTTPLQLRAVQQYGCVAGSCATSFTLQIPFELGGPAKLWFKENGSAFTLADVHPATDQVHILNTCDQTGVFVGIAASVPAGTCVPIVTHANAVLVTAAQPALAGETLIVWAFGLGALDRPVSPFCCRTPEDAPLAAQQFTTTFFATDQPHALWRRWSQTVPTYTGTPGAGLYQVHVIVPQPASGLASCSIGGNVRIAIGGPASSDVAEICVQ